MQDAVAPKQQMSSAAEAGEDMENWDEELEPDEEEGEASEQEVCPS